MDEETRQALRLVAYSLRDLNMRMYSLSCDTEGFDGGEERRCGEDIEKLEAMLGVK